MNIVNKLAYEFADQIADALTTDELEDVICSNRKNRGTHYAHTCRTGDIIDSNMCMGAAFTALGLDEPSADCQIETDLWNQAWDLAKSNDFFRGHVVTKTEQVLIIRHLSLQDKKQIIQWVEDRQDENEMEFACIQTFSGMDELRRGVEK